MKNPFLNRKKKHGIQQESVASTIGSRRPFANAEAYKRLRTNVLFSFSDDRKSHVIGVTSAMANEGKSTTAINLAYDMMKAGKRVLLIDADMRLSCIAMNLEIHRSPGLSNILAGNDNGENIVQRSPVQDHLPVISCGDIPPNPTELLSSNRMNIMLEIWKEQYEYIIIDLPPVTEVADALIVSKLTDGIIVVVRQDYTDQRLLADIIQQLRHSESNIIGFVMTCAPNETKYYKYKYRKYHARKYGYGCYSAYEQAAQEGEKQDDVSV